MRVGFKVYVQCGVAGPVAGLLESKYLGVFHSLVSVDTCAHDAAVRVDDDRADAGIGRGQSDTLARQLKRTVQELLVSGMVGHSIWGSRESTTETRSHGKIRVNATTAYNSRGG